MSTLTQPVNLKIKASIILRSVNFLKRIVSAVFCHVLKADELFFLLCSTTILDSLICCDGSKKPSHILYLWTSAVLVIFGKQLLEPYPVEKDEQKLV